MLTVGDDLKDFKVESLQGTINLSDFAGKYLVLFFYPKDDTPGCSNENQQFKNLYEEFKQLNTEVIGVSRDSIALHEHFVRKYDLPFNLISDEDSKLCELFGVLQEKSSFGRKSKGVVRSSFLISPEQKIIKEWRDVKVEGHAHAVYNLIAELEDTKQEQ